MSNAPVVLDPKTGQTDVPAARTELIDTAITRFKNELARATGTFGGRQQEALFRAVIPAQEGVEGDQAANLRDTLRLGD